jgi:coenzyme F420 hydrogenase subunit beta
MRTGLPAPQLPGRLLPVATQLAAEAGSLVRNLLLARLLGAEDMGLAALVALGLRLVEMAGALGLDRFLVQLPAGRSGRAQATLHGASLLVGAGLASLLAIAGPTLAPILAPSLDATLFLPAAAILMVRGAIHLDYRRQQRHGDFRAALWVEGVPALLSCLAIPALAVTGPGALVWALLLQAILAALASHLCARRPWRPALDPATLQAAVRFGAPLALNGIAMFAVLQGDRVLVAAELPAAELARFIVVGQCALLPVLAATRVVLSTELPRLARLREDGAALGARLRGNLGHAALAGAAGAIAFTAFAPALVPLLFGPDFSPTVGLAAAFGAAAALRLVRAVPNVALMALGRTRALFMAGLPRLGAVVGVFFLIAAGAPALDARALEVIVLAGAAGELASLLLALVLVSRALPRSPQRSSAMTHPVEKITRDHLCMGCGNCAAAFAERIRMVDTLEHGRRPEVVDATLTEAEAEHLERICPGVGIRPAVTTRDGDLDALTWGPVLEVWEGHATDAEVRWRGGSGGVVSALAAFAVDSGRVAGAVQVRARADAPLLNETVINRTAGDVLACAASRYAPASPCEGLADVARSGTPHLFVGKPCDVAGARALAREDSDVARNLELTISIFCAGTPSIAGTRALARRLGAREADAITDVRYRGNGWPGEMVVRWRDAATGAMRSGSTSYREGWGEVLTHHKQWRCQLCADHLGEHADLSVGDPWYREIGDGERGDSLVVVRTERGREALRAAMAAGAVVMERRDLATLAASQPNLEQTRGAVFGRCLTGRLTGAGAPRYPGAGLARIWLHRLGARAKLQSLAGTAKRIFRQGRRAPERFIRLVELDP